MRRGTRPPGRAIEAESPEPFALSPSPSALSPQPSALSPQPFASALRDLFQPQHRVLEIDRHAVAAQELVADDPTEAEPEERAGCVEVQHDDREVVVLDGVEAQAHARHQERVLVPAGRTEYLQGDAP